MRRAFCGWAIMTFVLTGCGKQDCSKIDLNVLAEIKYPQEINAVVKRLDDFPPELDITLHATHKLILRCRTEEEILHGRVLPGLMVWISDGWHLDTDTSKLGKVYHEHGVAPSERPLLSAVLYHRYSNDLPLDIDPLLADAAVRSVWAGRIKTVASLKSLSADQQQTLKSLIKASDSLRRRAARIELSLANPAEKIKKIISEKNSTLRGLDLIGDGFQYKVAIDSVFGTLDSLSRAQLGKFSQQSDGEKLIVLEEVRISKLSQEIKSISKQ